MKNGTMIQFYHWYSQQERGYWNYVKEKAAELSALGITSVWLPPAFKATGGGYSVGYDVYDLYDLGEFDQKGTIPTKYGTKDEYQQAVKSLQKQGLKVIVDIVLNHKGGGDETEKVTAVMVDENDRNLPVNEPTEIEAYTKFTFPGRKGEYSDFVWDYQCFSGVDFDNKTGTQAIYNIQQEWGSDWQEMIDDEKGNYDYLMYNDIEFRNPAVRAELDRWGKWYHDTVGFDGVRLDAVKHISPQFYNGWLATLRENSGKDIFAVGEYWAPGKLELLLRYIEATNGCMSLFDSSLHHNLHHASNAGQDYDLRNILNDSLVQSMPSLAVTVVDNHDTQPLQALEAPVEHWFKPLAYALILLRAGGYPCVFYPDLFGASYKDMGSDGNEHEINLEPVQELPGLLKVRNNNAYGKQRDYFDHGNCIGWTREGDEEHSGCAVLLSNGDDGHKLMEMGKRYAGKTFVGILEGNPADVAINEEGWGEFLVAAGTAAVYVLTDDSAQ